MTPTLRIVVADDEPDMRDYFQRVVEKRMPERMGAPIRFGTVTSSLVRRAPARRSGNGYRSMRRSKLTRVKWCNSSRGSGCPVGSSTSDW